MPSVFVATTKRHRAHAHVHCISWSVEASWGMFATANGLFGTGVRFLLWASILVVRSTASKHSSLEAHIAVCMWCGVYLKAALCFVGLFL